MPHFISQTFCRLIICFSYSLWKEQEKWNKDEVDILAKQSQPLDMNLGERVNLGLICQKSAHIASFNSFTFSERG